MASYQMYYRNNKEPKPILGNGHIVAQNCMHKNTTLISHIIDREGSLACISCRQTTFTSSCHIFHLTCTETSKFFKEHYHILFLTSLSILKTSIFQILPFYSLMALPAHNYLKVKQFSKLWQHQKYNYIGHFLFPHAAVEFEKLASKINRQPIQHPENEAAIANKSSNSTIL